jgi:hypothetical protein
MTQRIRIPLPLSAAGCRSLRRIVSGAYGGSPMSCNARLPSSAALLIGAGLFAPPAQAAFTVTLTQ